MIWIKTDNTVPSANKRLKIQMSQSDQIKLKELLDLCLAEFSRGNSPAAKHTAALLRPIEVTDVELR